MNEVKFKANIKDVLALQAEVAAIPEIPTPESTDEGKVLTVAVDSSGETPVVSYELEDVSGSLPAIESGDAGKVLTVNAGETAAEWANVPAELPAIGDSDAGKVLKVNAGHTGVEWGAASGGTTIHSKEVNVVVPAATIQNVIQSTSGQGSYSVAVQDVTFVPANSWGRAKTDSINYSSSSSYNRLLLLTDVYASSSSNVQIKFQRLSEQKADYTTIYDVTFTVILFWTD